MSYVQTPQRFHEGERVRVLDGAKLAYPRRTWGLAGVITGTAWYARTGIRRYHVRYTLTGSGQTFDEDIREEHLESADAPMLPAAPTMTARDVAKALIRPYVERGDALACLRRTQMGAYDDLGEAQIRLDHILVERIGPYHGGTPCNARFRLKDIYTEVQHEAKGTPQQASLWDGVEVSA